jgi:hypothetical protein
LNIGIRHTRIGKDGGRISPVEIGHIGLPVDDKLIAIISSKVGIVCIVQMQRDVYDMTRKSTMGRILHNTRKIASYCICHIDIVFITDIIINGNVTGIDDDRCINIFIDGICV